ncbi:MAG: hypothetical protein ABSG68_06800 [Thermoguttaceae bacterium]|jgi:hypothetical protein
MRFSITLATIVMTLSGLVAPLAAQQVTVGSPFNSGSDSFFERNGVGFSGNWRGFTFNGGAGFGLATPQFGGYDPSSLATTGFSIVGPQGRLNFNFAFGQGYRQSLVTQTPSITLMNGQTGYFSDTSQTPFVISEVPVVGGGFAPIGFFNPMPSAQMLQQMNNPGVDPAVNPRIQALRQAMQNVARQDADPAAVVGVPAAAGLPAQPNPGLPAARPRVHVAQAAAPELPPVAARATTGERLAAAQASSAGRAAPSVAEAQRLHEMESSGSDDEVAALVERGRAAEADGKPKIAKIYYRMAAKRGSGELKEQAQARLDALQTDAADQ